MTALSAIPAPAEAPAKPSLLGLTRARAGEHRAGRREYVMKKLRSADVTEQRRLNEAREAGVLRSAKVGREVWCWPDPDAVRAALGAVDGYLKAHFRTGGGPRTGAASSPAAGRGARR